MYTRYNRNTENCHDFLSDHADEFGMVFFTPSNKGKYNTNFRILQLFNNSFSNVKILCMWKNCLIFVAVIKRMEV